MTEKQTQNLNKILKAAKQKRKILILYKKAKNKYTRRILGFYSWDKDNELVYAWDFTKGRHIKSFAMSKITQVKVLEIKYRPKYQIEC